MEIPEEHQRLLTAIENGQRVFVAAGNRRQFEYLMHHELGLSRNHPLVHYISDYNALHGCHDFALYRYGTWYENRVVSKAVEHIPHYNRGVNDLNEKES